MKGFYYIWLQVLFFLLDLSSLIKHVTCHLATERNDNDIRKSTVQEQQQHLQNKNGADSDSDIDEANVIERKLQQPMPMHRHFMLQQQQQRLLSAKQKRRATWNMKRKDNSNIPSMKSEKDDNTNANQRESEHRALYKSGNRVLDASWWFRFDEGSLKPETRRSHHSTLYSFDKALHNVDKGGADNADNATGDMGDTDATGDDTDQADKDDEHHSTATDTKPPSPSPTIDTSTDTPTISPTNSPVTSSPTVSVTVSPTEASSSAPTFISTIDSNKQEDDHNDTPPPQNINTHPNNNSSDSNNNTTTTTENQNNRKLHRSTYTTTMQEYMIISGGFTDLDWHTFPVWAFDINAAVEEESSEGGQWFEITRDTNSAARNGYGGHTTGYGDHDRDGDSSGDEPHHHHGNKEHNEKEEQMKAICNNHNDLAFNNNHNDNDGKKNDLWTTSALFCPPQSRVGHISVMRQETLYVFGGLLYNEKEGVFYMEEEPYMYRMYIPSDYFTNPSKYDDVTTNHNTNNNALSWERIIPNVAAPPPSTHTNGGGSNSGGSEYTRPEDIINRGEVRGGYWEEKDLLIIYGGLHVRDYETSYSREQQADETLGDVWAYDFKTDTWEMMAPAWADTGNIVPPPTNGKNGRRDHPGERTSHSATVIGDELIVFGGLRKVETYLWDGSTIWDQLDDVWVFNLNTKQWKERVMKESIGRAYHSIVGWENEGAGGEGAVMASFGGYKTMTDPVDNQQISYVYDDTLVTFPNPDPSENETTSSFWFLATYEGVQLSISTRLEHTAVLSKLYGNMIVWGGRYRGTSEIDGVWSLNIHGKNNNVLYVIREDDHQAENVGVAYIVLVTVMLMSMMFTYMCGIVHRQIENDEGTNISIDQVMDPNNGFSFARRNGLRQDVIDTLPLKTYEPDEGVEVEMVTRSTPQQDSSRDEMNQDIIVSQQHDLGYDAENDDNCCPICIVEYRHGDELRQLPCGHEFHKSCVDSWLKNSASCPSCRHSLQDLSSLTTMSPTRQNSENQTEGEEEGETREGTVRVSNIAPAVLFPQFLSRIGRTRQRNQPSIHTAASGDSQQGSPPRIHSSNSGNDSDSIGDLELSYSSSLEWDDNPVDIPGRNGRRGRNFRPIRDGDSNELPIHGRSRRMRVSGSERRRNRGNRTRLTGRRRGGARSPLNDPLQPSEGRMV